MKSQCKILIIPVIALIVSALITLCASFYTYIQASDRISHDGSEIESILETGSKVTVLFSDQEKDSFGRYVGELVISLSEQEQVPLRLRATVWVREGQSNKDQPVQYVIEDVNPIYVSREILKINKRHVVSVDLERIDGRRLLYDTIRIDNSFYFNIYLLLAIFAVLVFLLFLAASAVSVLRNRTPVNGAVLCVRTFPVLCLGAGLLLCICLPLNKVGADEETHLQSVVQLAAFPSGELHISDVLMNQLIVTEYNNPEAQPSGAKEQEEFSDYLSEYSDYKYGNRSPEFAVPLNRIPAYLSMAVACKAGKGLSLPWAVILRLIRLANLLTYTILVFAALKLTPSGHALFLLIGLLPENIFLASTVSYDAFINGAVLLSMAFLLRMLKNREGDQKSLWSDLAGFSIPLALACLVKVVYAPLFLAALPVAARKKKDKTKQTLLILLLLVVFLTFVLIFIVPTLIDPSASGDVRGGEVSIRDQLLFICSNPIAYSKILLSQMIGSVRQCYLGPDCTTFMGHLVHGGTSYQGSWILILILLISLTAAGIVCLTKQKETSLVSGWERLWLLATCFASSALIWTAMYLAFTPPGAEEIAGVQGRYFIPLLFLVYFSLGAATEPAEQAFSGRITMLVRNRGLWYHLMILLLGSAVYLQLWKAVILPYCI